MISNNLEKNQLLKFASWYKRNILSRFGNLRGLTFPFLLVSGLAVRSFSNKAGEGFEVLIREGEWRVFSNLELVKKYVRIEYDLTVDLIDITDEEDVFFDIGAYKGFHTLIGSLGDRVYSFEPNPGNLEFLRENVELNADEEIEIIDKPVWDKKEVLEIGSGEGPQTSVGKGSLEKESITIDGFVESEDVVPDIIKIDVEGAEYNVLQGMSDTLSEHRPKLFIEVHVNQIKGFGAEHEDVEEFLKEKGYIIEKKTVRGSQIHLYAEPVD